MSITRGNFLFIGSMFMSYAAREVYSTYTTKLKKKWKSIMFALCSIILSYNFLDPLVTELQIFCDSCSGQNKNFTMFRFLHHLVNIERRLQKIKVTFPIRGHSYLECDKK
ncbi:unnamed protein product [Psylliodes chrysocephalus]|uniref:DUF7869 domain-containing protein n=1 Tax=Psylliodes chrysocephalus TaxID=3402493 RepID=A0A9P0D285_9CUCU|nr:unnamed protein product [Psylliodes chrysocephala]